MEVLRFDDAAGFLERAMPLLAPDADAEARHNLMLGIAGTVARDPSLYSAFRAWLAVEGDRPLAVVLAHVVGIRETGGKPPSAV